MVMAASSMAPAMMARWPAPRRIPMVALLLQRRRRRRPFVTATASPDDDPLAKLQADLAARLTGEMDRRPPAARLAPAASERIAVGRFDSDDAGGGGGGDLGWADRVISVHHETAQGAVTEALMGAENADAILSVWHEHRDAFGWFTAAQALNRAAKLRVPLEQLDGGAGAGTRIKAVKTSSHVALDFGPSSGHRGDARLVALLRFVRTALAQGNMTSRGRLGWPTDDLKRLRASLAKLELSDSACFAKLEDVLAREEAYGESAVSGDDFRSFE